MSVVIPSHNYGQYLPAAVGSAIDQEGVDVDVVIIDDCSTDGSERIVQQLASCDSHIRAVVHKVNLGHVMTYNEGIASAEGDYLVLLSADDLLSPGSLLRATTLLEDHPSVGLVYGGVRRFSGEPPKDSQHIAESWTIWNGHDWLRERCQDAGNWIYSPEVVMRTSVQRRVGAYSVELPHTADFEMWLRTALVADIGRVNGATQAFYRVHQQNLHRNFCAGASDEYRALHDAYESVLTRGSPPPGSEQLYQSACRSLASKALDDVRDASEKNLSRQEVRDLVVFAREMSPALVRARSPEVATAFGRLGTSRPTFRSRLRSLRAGGGTPPDDPTHG